MRIGFLGAAGEVTGSCYLVWRRGLPLSRRLRHVSGADGRPTAESTPSTARRSAGHRLRPPLTHAHIDHSGLLPRLALLGFHGPIYTTVRPSICSPSSCRTAPTSRKKRSGNCVTATGAAGPAGVVPPLYTVAQAQSCLRLLQPVAYGETVAPVAGYAVASTTPAHPGFSHCRSLGGRG